MNNLNWQAAEIKTIYNQLNKKDFKIIDSQSSFKYLKNIFDQQEKHVENFNVLYLNAANQVIGWKNIGIGGVSGVVADVKVIMKYALDILATSIIISHNHPSGNKKASQQDIALTNRLKETCKIFDISLLDHIIICDTEYISLAEEGLI